MKDSEIEDILDNGDDDRDGAIDIAELLRHKGRNFWGFGEEAFKKFTKH